jgi:tripartite-type tricarboxylate transporter receptor subunit TctC
MKRLGLFVLVLLALCAQQSFAQNFPNRTLRIVVPFPPGGVTDLAARTIAKNMGDDLGQVVIVDNRPGAGGKVGTTHVATAAPDGYTMGLMTSGTHTILPVIDAKLGYDAEQDFAPIGLIMSTPFTLYVGGATPYKSVADLVADAKARPGVLNYASAGVGTAHHMFFELFKAQAKIDIVHVPYRGEAPALNDVLSGAVPMIMMAGGDQHISTGRLRPLATTGSKRWFVLPGTPTVAESGYPEAEALGWAGLVAPAKTPPEILARLQAALASATARDDVAKIMRDAGYELLPAQPGELARWIKADRAKWHRLVTTAGLKFDDQ